MKLLLIEDHVSLRTMVAAHLAEQGFTVTQSASGTQAIAAASAEPHDAAILDLGLPDMDGLDLLRTLRARHADMPVLILTARDSVAQRIAGLDAGADDYILKPFELAEMEARLRAVLRRPGIRQTEFHVFGDLRFDSLRRSAQSGTRSAELTRREGALFEALIRSGETIMVRDDLAQRLYGSDDDVSANALEATVSRLRRKLATLGTAVRVDVVRGIGYRLRHGRPPV